MEFIENWHEGDSFEGNLLVVNCVKGVSNNGQPYLSLTLQDKTGTIDAKKWDSSDEDFAICTIGNVIKINLDVIEYRGVLQAKVLKVEAIDQQKLDYTRFCLSSPIAQEELVRKLNKYISFIENEDCKKIIDLVFKRHYEEFISYPAATRNHHEFSSGLLYHTVSMLDLAAVIVNLYPKLSRDLLFTGVILHDIGKTIELSGPIATKYTLEGKLIGHITLMVAEVRSICEQANIHSEVPLLLEHMILSHHGEQEFGSPVPPLTREAFALHMIDDFDAKMIMIDKALIGVKEGDFSLRIPSLDGRSFYNYKKI